ncbi:MAG: DUF86 domain-containing protein [Candidatus Delongbacteria bacterium]|nr:DUF86 domain-containing protein [Candidatus Delongbacteria bacterium]MBN2835423.1 DUF86 domain-containing protein [Candidatus Delongbacteria bacterium]
MYDILLVKGILSQIENACETVIHRFSTIKTVSDFTDSPSGKEKLDSICMQLFAIGESLKNIDKITDFKLLSKYTDVDWKGAKGMRDIISHHYFDIDAEEIYYVCENKIDEMKEVIHQIIIEL